MAPPQSSRFVKKIETLQKNEELGSAEFDSVMTADQNDTRQTGGAARLALLVSVIKNVPPAVLRAKCSTFSAILNAIVRQYKDSDNVEFLTHVLGCIAILLRAQHYKTWCQDDKLKDMLTNILPFTTHGVPRIRKSGQYTVSEVLKDSEFMVKCPSDTHRLTNKEDLENSSIEQANHNVEATELDGVCSNGSDNKDQQTYEIHPAADLVADFLLTHLKSTGRRSSAANKSTLHIMLVFTRQVIMAMPEHKLQVILDRLFSLVTPSKYIVNTMVLQALQALCTAQPPASVLSLALTDELFSTLTKHRVGVCPAIIPAPHDPVAVEAWSSVVTAALGHAIRLSTDEGIEWCGVFCRVAPQYWQAANEHVLSTMEESISTALSRICDVITQENCATHELGVQGVVQGLEAGLSYQCQDAWPCVFRLLGQCYSELGRYYATTMMPSFKKMYQLMAENSNLSSVKELENAVRKAMKGLGVETVMFSAPLTITGDIATDEKNLWLLPLLRKFVKSSRLVFFIEHFVPLAEKCSSIIYNLKSEEVINADLLSTYKTIEYQIWALLPSFANKAIDVEEALDNKNFTKVICDLIEYSDQSRIDAMAALRHMMVADGSSTGRLARYANNYLPALFKVFVKEPKSSKNAHRPEVIEASHRLAAIATIVAYLKIVPQTLSNSFMMSILEKSKVVTNQHVKYSLLRIARCFVPHVTGELVENMLDTIESLIRSANDRREEKAAYRILEEVLSDDSIGMEEFINDQLLELSVLLLESKSKAGASSKAHRLRCAKVVLSKVSSSAEIETREHFLVNIVEESVICCGRSNSTAARKAAFLLLADLPQAIKRIHGISDSAVVQECMLLLSGLLLSRPTLSASTIIAITAFTYQTKESMPVDILEQNVCNMSALLRCSDGEVVEACLSFVKAVLVMCPVTVLGSVVKVIMAGIVGMTQDCARKYSVETKNILARLTKKFGDDNISKLIPAKHTTLHKLIRNMRKEVSHMQQQKEYEERGVDVFSKKASTSVEEILVEIDPGFVGEYDDDTKKIITLSSTKKEDMGDGDMEDVVHVRVGSKSGKSEKRKRRRAQVNDDNYSDDIPLSKRAKNKNNFDYCDESRAEKSFGDLKLKGWASSYAFSEITKDRRNKRNQAKYKASIRRGSMSLRLRKGNKRSRR